MTRAYDWWVMIPARAASTRLPGKALADLHGLPMVVRVARQALLSGATRVLVATDDPAIQKVVQEHGLEAELTAADHATGTDRLAELCQRHALADEAIVVNVQGDEPLIPPGLIEAVANALARHPQAAMATAACPLNEQARFFDPNTVKVVCDQGGYALYFSRAPIPWPRDALGNDPAAVLPQVSALHHIGIYAYRAGFLRRFPKLSSGALERLESLEQLRALEHGYRIVVHQIDHAPAGGVDTAEDLARVRALLAKTERPRLDTPPA